MAVQNDSSRIEEYSSQAMLTFKLDKQTFALPVDCVRQIIEMITITPLPQVKEFVEGAVNFHGAVVPVVNLRAYFGLPRQKLGLHTPIILVNLSGRLLGLIIDEVIDVLKLPESQIAKPKDILPEALGDAAFLRGVIQQPKGMLMLLDFDRLFQNEQVQQAIEKAQRVIGALGEAPDQNSEPVQQETQA